MSIDTKRDTTRAETRLAPRVVPVAVYVTDGARTSGAHLPRTGKHTLRVLAILLGPVHSHRDNTTRDVAVAPPTHVVNP